MTTLAPFLQPDDSDVSELVTRRIRRAPPEVRKTVFGEGYLTHGFWLLKTSAVLSIDAKSNIKAAHRRKAAFGHPYPGLLSPDPDAIALFSFGGRGRGTIANLSFEIKPPGGVAIKLTEDAAITLVRVGIEWGTPDGRRDRYVVETVYAVSFGKLYSAENCLDRFQELIAAHIAQPIERK